MFHGSTVLFAVRDISDSTGCGLGRTKGDERKMRVVWRQGYASGKAKNYVRQGQIGDLLKGEGTAFTQTRSSRLIAFDSKYAPQRHEQLEAAQHVPPPAQSISTETKYNGLVSPRLLEACRRPSMQYTNQPMDLPSFPSLPPPSLCLLSSSSPSSLRSRAGSQGRPRRALVRSAVLASIGWAIPAVLSCDDR